MLTRVLIAAACVAVAMVVARRLDRRRERRDPPPRDAYPVPRQLDRNDFPRADAPWIVVLFSSTTCDSCITMAPKVAALECTDVATHNAEFHADPALHQRYEISGIPTTVIADHEGVVRAAWVGAVTATDLWSALAEARVPGSTPEPNLGTLD